MAECYYTQLVLSSVHFGREFQLEVGLGPRRLRKNRFYSWVENRPSGLVIVLWLTFVKSRLAKLVIVHPASASPPSGSEAATSWRTAMARTRAQSYIMTC